MYVRREELNRETVYLMHPSSIHGVEDMSTLAELHEAAIMHNLFLRYKKDNIYVSECKYKTARPKPAKELRQISESRTIGPNWKQSIQKKGTKYDDVTIIKGYGCIVFLSRDLLIFSVNGAERPLCR